MNIQARPDTTGYAPRDCRYHATDDDTYDYAPDQRRASSIGYGATEGEAIADLLEIMQAEGEITLDEYHEALLAYGVKPVYRGPDRADEEDAT